MTYQDDLIDLRGAPPDPEPQGADMAPDAIHILTGALIDTRDGARPEESWSHAAAPGRDNHASTTADAIPAPAPPPAGLKGLESLPRSMRRRVNVSLAEGEQVECAMHAVRGGGAEWILATSHRILVDEPSTGHLQGTMSLPYHRTTVSATDDGRLDLRCAEFGRARSASILPAPGYTQEANHLIHRLRSS